MARKHGNVEPDRGAQPPRRVAHRRSARSSFLAAGQGAGARHRSFAACAVADPAAEIAGRLLASKGETRQASRLVARTWKLAPHPDLATVYAFAKPGESPRERLKRVEYLASLTPGNIEGQIAIAVAAIEARDWQTAEAALSPYLHDRPPARICALMARVEAGEGNKGREREWLARAVRGPRDRAWIADGYISDRWLPVSPVTGAVDAFEWKAPVDAIGRGDETLLIEESHEPPEPPHAVEGRGSRREVAKVEKVEAKKPELAAPRRCPKRRRKQPAAGDHRSGHAGYATRAACASPNEA